MSSKPTESRDGIYRITLQIPYRLSEHKLAEALIAMKDDPSIKTKKDFIKQFKLDTMMYGDEWIDAIYHRFESEEEYESAVKEAKIQIRKWFKGFEDTR